MIVAHLNRTPQIHLSAYVAPNATVCGDVIIGAGCRIMFGACLVAEGKTLNLGKYCIVMENAVIRSTDKHPTEIGSYCLIGPVLRFWGLIKKTSSCDHVAARRS